MLYTICPGYSPLSLCATLCSDLVDPQEESSSNAISTNIRTRLTAAQLHTARAQLEHVYSVQSLRRICIRKQRQMEILAFTAVFKGSATRRAIYLLSRFCC